MSGFKISGLISTGSRSSQLWMNSLGKTGFKKSGIKSNNSGSIWLKISSFERSGLWSSGLGSTQLWMSSLGKSGLRKSGLGENGFEKSNLEGTNSILHYDGRLQRHAGNFKGSPACFCLQSSMIVKI